MAHCNANIGPCPLNQQDREDEARYGTAPGALPRGGGRGGFGAPGGRGGYGAPPGRGGFFGGPPPPPYGGFAGGALPSSLFPT